MGKARHPQSTSQTEQDRHTAQHTNRHAPPSDNDAGAISEGTQRGGTVRKQKPLGPRLSKEISTSFGRWKENAAEFAGAVHSPLVEDAAVLVQSGTLLERHVSLVVDGEAAGAELSRLLGSTLVVSSRSRWQKQIRVGKERHECRRIESNNVGHVTRVNRQCVAGLS